MSLDGNNVSCHYVGIAIISSVVLFLVAQFNSKTWESVSS